MSPNCCSTLQSASANSNATKKVERDGHTVNLFSTLSEESTPEIRVQFLSQMMIDLHDIWTITNGLQKIQQRQWDSSQNSFVNVSGEKYNDQFMAQVTLYPTNARYPVDLLELFWAGLLQGIKTHAASSSIPYTLPSRHCSEPNGAATHRLRSLKDTAIRFEVQLSNLTKIVNKCTHPSNDRGPVTRHNLNGSLLQPSLDNELTQYVSNAPFEQYDDLSSANVFSTNPIQRRAKPTTVSIRMSTDPLGNEEQGVDDTVAVTLLNSLNHREYNLHDIQSQIMNIRSTAKANLRRTFTQFKEEIQDSKD